MKSSCDNCSDMAREHAALLGQYGRVQRRCTELVIRQVEQIEQLQADMMKLRAQLIMRDTALAFAREDLAALQTAIPDLPARTTLARRVESLTRRVQELMRERLKWPRQNKIVVAPANAAAVTVDLREKSVLCIGQDDTARTVAQKEIEEAGGHFLHYDGQDEDDGAMLEASLIAADLVICQTGCVSHDAYWRVQDHCQRTGKQCVLVGQPQAMHFVRGVNASSDTQADADAPIREAEMPCDK